MRRAIVLALLTVSALFAADWTIQIQPKGKLRATKDVTIEVTIKDTNGHPIDGADVTLAMTMADMDHGELQSIAKPIKPGVYDARAKFIMSGAWNIEVRAKRGDDSATFKQKVDVTD